MEFKDFKEVEANKYATHSGERICYWDSEHKQHFFIKGDNKIEIKILTIKRDIEMKEIEDYYNYKIKRLKGDLCA